MGNRKPPRSLDELLDRFDEAADKSDKVSLDQLMDEVGRRSFGPLLLLGGLIMCAPVVGDIPGVPILLGLFVLLVAVQLLVGRKHFWLPKWLLNRSVASEKLKKTTGKWLRRPAKFVDRFLGKRLRFLTGPWGARAMAIASALLALTTPIAEFIPFSANGIGLGICLFGLALIAQDGLFALVGWVVVSATLGLGAYALL